MKTYLILVSITIFIQDLYSQPYTGLAYEEVNFKTKDSIVVYADYVLNDKSSKSIILFHQAGSNARGEYNSILPKLHANGYSVLAVDLRLGGDLFDGKNRTIQNLNIDYEYCDALPDMRASIEFMIGKGHIKDIVIWGSSYSAGLCFQIAEEFKSNVSGLVACSPAAGGPMEKCQPDLHMKKYEGNALVLRPKKEMEYPWVKKQFEKAEAQGKLTFVSETGVHGSSMFVENRTKNSTEAVWDQLYRFLDAI